MQSTEFTLNLCSIIPFRSLFASSLFLLSAMYPDCHPFATSNEMEIGLSFQMPSHQQEVWEYIHSFPEVALAEAQRQAEMEEVHKKRKRNSGHEKVQTSDASGFDCCFSPSVGG